MYLLCLLCSVSPTFPVQCAVKLLKDFLHPVVILWLKPQHSSSSSFYFVAVYSCCSADPYFRLTFQCSTVRQWHISCHTSTFHASKGRVSSSLKQAFRWRRAFKVLRDERTQRGGFYLLMLRQTRGCLRLAGLQLYHHSVREEKV